MNRGFLAMVLALPMVLAGPEAVRDQGGSLGDVGIAARAINALGLEILRLHVAADGNVVLSPYSIQLASAMTYAGSEGETRREMAATLHYPDDEALVHGSFAETTRALEEVSRRTATNAKRARRGGNRPGDAIMLTVANRLYGQRGYPFRRAFLSLLDDTYRAPFAEVDFVGNAEGVTREINAWVAKRTRERIRDLIPRGTLHADTRLVLVNAIYFKAPWQKAFPSDATKPMPFLVRGEESVNVPTMTKTASFGYLKHADLVAITIPYSDPDLQFLVLMPEQGVTLRDLEESMTSDRLVELGQAPARALALFLPKFRLEPPTVHLGSTLSSLGMKTAFDPREADFRRMDSTRNLFVSEVLHKAFLAIDEQGTEAAAATAYIMVLVSGAVGRVPEAHVDRPFLFAIQHRPSGACLFLGRVTDPQR